MRFSLGFFFVFAALLFGGMTSPAAAEGECLLKGGETIVFFGDSITQNGSYVNDFEAYLLTRFPKKTFRVINHGISSETISGTSEEDHHPRRPWALPRFTRDVVKWKPDVVVACFGMNDGNYHPFEPTRFKAYQKGIRTLIARVKKETSARLILMTPPPFDPYRRRVHDPKAKTFGYKFASIDYDETLRHYSEWLVTLRKEGQVVVDLHSSMNAHIKTRRKKRVSFHLSPDAVHPNATGHFLMALHLLWTLNAPAMAADVEIDAATLKTNSGDLTGLKRVGSGVSFRWKSAIPMPLDSNWDAQSLKLEKVSERLSRYRLRIRGLPVGTYAMIAGGRQFGDATAKELSNGVDLASFTRLSTVESAGKLRGWIKYRRGLRYRLWRSEIGRPFGPAIEKSRVADLEKLIVKFDRDIHTARQPQTLTIRVERKSKR